MLFHTLHFVVFFGIVLVLYNWTTSVRFQNWQLLIASYYFYGSWDWRFLLLLLVTTLTDYWMGIYIHAQRARGDILRAKAGLFVSLVVNLGILGFFKYWNFFAWGASRLLDSVGVHVSWVTLNIVLPVGLSFYVFQSMSYTIDVYRGVQPPVRSLRDFALYVSFFPQLVAGPIERARDLLPQLQEPRSVKQRDLQEGVTLILIGLVRKVVIADTAGVVADIAFGDPAKCTSLQLLCALVLYGIQIYGDFAGYSDMARGVARLMGIRLMRNFCHPYFSKSVREFWRRWHISLSTWLRDYVYIPLGGSRSGGTRSYLNLMATMLAGGLWHGAHWTFLFWGAVHGGLLALHRAASHTMSAPCLEARRWVRFLRDQGGRMVTFVAVLFAWLPFRMNNIDDMWSYLRYMAVAPVWDIRTVFPVLLLWMILLAIDIPQHISGNEYVFLRMPLIGRILLMGLAVVLINAAIGGAARPFIYFQF